MADGTPRIDDAALAKLLPTLKRSLHTRTGALWEARCTRMLEREIPNFVVGAEDAPADCGLVFTDARTPPLEGNLSTRLADVVARHEYEAVVVPLDFKKITLRDAPAWKGLWAYYALSASSIQAGHCAAFLVGSAQSPTWVLVIPRHYLLRGERFLSWPRAAARLSRPNEPFPMQWMPFAMPVTFLKAAILSLDTFCRDSTAKW